MVGQRHEMLEEAIEVIDRLFTGERVSHRGRYYQVESARPYDVPELPVPVEVVASGQESCRIEGQRTELMNATEPKP